MRKKYENKSNILKISDEEYTKKKEALTSFFLDKSYVIMTAKQIANVLNVKKEEKEILDKILLELENEGLVFVDDSKRYVLMSTKSNMVKCKYLAKTEKFGFGLLENDDDIYIDSKFSNTAMSNDEVLVKIIKEKTSTKNAEGIVVKVLKRNTDLVIGRFIKSENFGFVEPIDKKINDIYIPKKFAQNIQDGKMVEVKITKYSNGKSKSEGKIVSIIGDENTDNIEVKALYKSYGLDKLETFDNLVEKELENIPDVVLPEEKIGREDRTNFKAYTIDGEDAKDLDDAVFVKKLDNGGYLLSVYIADVSHYVKDGSKLDMEAMTRGTSIYIPGTVLPMLPRKLSNGICSLNQGEERLSLAVDMTYDKNGNLIDSNIFKTVIKVTKKMSYEKVYKVFTNSDEKVISEYRDYINDLNLMKELAILLKSKRKEMGSINFDLPDTKIVLDDKGNVTDIAPYEKTIANDIIEEFMLAANMTVAKQFFFLELPFIYRIHEKPDEEKLRELNEILSSYNKNIKGIKNVQPKVISKLLDEFDNEEEKKFISTYILRTLKLARYSEQCDGHFGLAAKYYCHFTSPIRRYPDLFIHRVISDYIASNGIINDEKIAKYSAQSVQYSISSSDAEKNSTVIERDFDDLYKAIYMEKFIGETFEATVSSVTSFGMFVELKNTVEGLVPFSNMPDDDFYEFDETKKILFGRRNGKIYKASDKVKVELVKSDVKTKQIDFMIIEE